MAEVDDDAAHDNAFLQVLCNIQQFQDRIWHP